MSAAPVGFEEFVAWRSPALLRTAWLLTGSSESAKDLVQSTLVTVWPRWGSIRRTDDPEVYVRQVMVHTYAKWWRRRWRGEVPTEVLPDRAVDDPAFAAVDVRESVRRALADLPRGQRAVVVLRHFDDFTEAQTARALGCSVGTVKSQHSRAMAALRTSPYLVGLAVDELTGGAP
jgi:RNA polymerase sigma-70 factor (sigma-E family)